MHYNFNACYYFIGFFRTQDQVQTGWKSIKIAYIISLSYTQGTINTRWERYYHNTSSVSLHVECAVSKWDKFWSLNDHKIHVYLQIFKWTLTYLEIIWVQKYGNILHMLILGLRICLMHRVCKLYNNLLLNMWTHYIGNYLHRLLCMSWGTFYNELVLVVKSETSDVKQMYSVICIQY